MRVKYFGIMVVFFLLLAAVSADAWDEMSTDDLKNLTYFDNDTEISVNNFDFTIPKGYGISDKFNFSETDEDGITSDYRIFFNGNDSFVLVSVMSAEYGMYFDTNYLIENYVPMTIKNHDGYVQKYMDYYSFIYLDDGYVINVAAESLDEIDKIVSY